MECFTLATIHRPAPAILGLLRPTSLHPPPRVESKATCFEDRISRNKPFGSQHDPHAVRWSVTLCPRTHAWGAARCECACDALIIVISNGLQNNSSGRAPLAGTCIARASQADAWRSSLPPSARTARRAGVLSVHYLLLLVRCCRIIAATRRKCCHGHLNVGLLTPVKRRCDTISPSGKEPKGSRRSSIRVP